MRKRTRIHRRTSYGVCPLCEKVFPRPQLQAPMKAEPPKSCREIIEAIRQKHPAWVSEEGACKLCWRSFRGVARVLGFMKKFKSDRL